MPDCGCECGGVDYRLGTDDLFLGCGSLEVERAGVKKTIKGINAGNLIYCDSGKPVSYYLDEIRRMFPLIECGVNRPTVDIGNWSDAVIAGEVNSCALGLPGTVEQRVPAELWDVTSHEGENWVSLVHDNTTEPSDDNPKWCNVKNICNDVRITGFEMVNGNLVITRSDGTTYSVAQLPNDGLPTGGKMFVAEIGGNFETTIGDTHVTEDFGDVYEVLPFEQTFSVADYPYLATPGNVVHVKVDVDTGYHIESPQYEGLTDETLSPFQWSTGVAINGDYDIDPDSPKYLDGFALDKSGSNENVTMSKLVTFVTDGKDLTVKVNQWLYDQNIGAVAGDPGDKFLIDVSTVVVTFSPGKGV